jgi:O-acetyl-ADP-ribose deacetylase (regulator of RNase III)
MNPVILAEDTEGRCTLRAVLGDMTLESVDAIVNAANTHLAHGGGLAAAIVDRGGLVIQAESDLVAPVAVGDAAVTTAGDLPSRWVIHAVGPVWGAGNEESLLRSAVRASLERAADLDAASIAIPAISTGIFGYPKEEGTAVIVDEARAWIGDHPAAPLRAVRFVAFDRPTAELFAAAVAVNRVPERRC